MLLANNHPLGRLGIAWQLSEFHGWGVFGLNLALSAASSTPLAIKLLHPHGIDSGKYPQLAPALREWSENEAAYKNSAGQIRHSDTTVIHSLGNDFNFTSNQHWGKRNIGFIFFENTAFSARGLARAQTLDLVIAGSRWNAELLVQAGLKKVAYVMQGVDLQRFGTVTKNPQANPNRFVIFSGGKLEYRKGQDIVLAAFSAFHQKRPDSVLMTAWHNPWPAISQDLANSPHGFGAPKIVNNQIDIAEWCARSGLPASAFLHVGATPNAQMPAVYGQADVALFPNRAEGGTNLVAMEAMAASVPCILSANTGHLDLIASNNCFALTNQTPFTNPTHQDWGQSSVDEIVQTLEHAYQHRSQLAQTGMAGRQFIAQFSWAQQTRQLIECCSNTY
jgi:glycosyltransferase involved in cell wall biosynthesis